MVPRKSRHREPVHRQTSVWENVGRCRGTGNVIWVLRDTQEFLAAGRGLGTSGRRMSKHKHDVWGSWIGPRRLERRGRGLSRKGSDTTLRTLASSWRGCGILRFYVPQNGLRP